MGKAMRGVMEVAMAWAMAAESARRVAGVMSMMFAVVSLGDVVTSVLSLSTGLSPSSLLTECHKMIGATACIALLSLPWTPGRGMGVTTFVAVSMG